MRVDAQPEVLITGVGLVTAAGTAPTEVLARVRAAGGADDLLRTRAAPAPIAAAGRVPVAWVEAPDPATFAGLRRPFPDRMVLMAMRAAELALADAELGVPALGDRVGLVAATAFGPSETVERYLEALMRNGPQRVSPIDFSRAVANAFAGEIARRHGLRGPSSVVVGASAIAYGVDILRDGDADAVLCLGVDEVRDVHRWAYQEAGLLDGGMRLGEGAAAVVLERRECARRRIAPVRALVASHASVFCAAARQMITRVSSATIEAAAAQALERAGCGPQDINVLVSLANGDADLQAAESTATERLRFDVSETLTPRKALGELFGAGGALGVALGAVALSEVRSRKACLVHDAQVGGSITAVVLRGGGND